AAAAGIIAPATRSALEAVAKRLFYRDRTYPLILKRAGEKGLPGGELAALVDWLPHGRVDQKREDAVALLETLRRDLAAAPGPKRVTYAFEPTTKWASAAQRAQPRRAPPRKAH